MPDIREDRDWVEAVDRYLETNAPPKRQSARPGSSQGRYVLGSALVLALLVSPFAVATTGDVLREGKRNPSSGSAKRETEIISSNDTYGTRQSNIQNGNGGGAVYGCRSKTGQGALHPRQQPEHGARLRIRDQRHRGWAHRGGHAWREAAHDQRHRCRHRPELRQSRQPRRRKGRLQGRSRDGDDRCPQPRWPDPACELLGWA